MIPAFIGNTRLNKNGEKVLINICPKCHSENALDAQVCSTCGLQLDVSEDLMIAHTKFTDFQYYRR
jgi:predicted amidophosphoribosyltransferase